MVKISLDEINLSKMHPEVLEGMDRASRTLNNRLRLKTAKVPFHYSSILLRTKIGLANTNKIGGLL